MKIEAGKYGRQETLAEIIKAIVVNIISNKLYDADKESIELEIGAFDNCRESGYTYSLIGGEQDNVFCVYEHRNSDQICINGCKREDVKSYGPYSGETKWDTLHNADYEEYHETAEELVKYLFQSYNGNFNQDLFK